MSLRNGTIISTILSAAALLAVACASIGSPDGGPYDEAPPIFLASTPVANATGASESKITLDFDEFVKLQNAYEKIVVSPPQMQQPEIKANGRRITVELLDTLKPSTTYTIDFNDAIADNNESNPLEAFSFVFSTGSTVDTLGVSGTVLEASNLEPIKGILVGIHSDLSDSAFRTKPFDRISRTDSRGRFNMRGMAPGKYRIYALADANGNYRFDQKSEKIAYLDSLIVPYATPAWRSDTVWHDSITIDTIRQVRYTRLQPDNIVLRAFQVPLKQQYLVKNPREKHNSFKLFFSEPADTLPTIRGIDFDAEDAFVAEANATNDTILYWIKDTTVYHRDTLTVEITYMSPDSMEVYHPRSDTVRLIPRRSRARILEDEKRKFEEDEKAFLRAARREKGYDKDNPPKYIPPVEHLKFKSNTSQSMDLTTNCTFSFEQPLIGIDTSAIHVSIIVDSVPNSIPYVFRQSEKNIRDYIIYAEWRPGETYKIEVDSAAFKGLYGNTTQAIKQEIKFKSLDEYSVLHLAIPRTGNNAVVELLNKEGNPVASQRTEKNRCSFYFIRPDKYYIRLFMDTNGNGKWDTGSYDEKRQPETTYYYPRPIELRAMFEYDQDDWNIGLAPEKQKPLEITKQKPERKREKRNRNAERKFK